MGKKFGVIAGIGLAIWAVGLGLGALLTERVYAQEAPWPKDIDPRTGYRLPLPTREDMRTDEDRQIYDEMTKGRGPVLWLYNPKLAKAMTGVHAYLKNDSALDQRLVKIAVLVTARALNSQIEWTLWEGFSRAGQPPAVEPAIIDMIKYCKPVSGLGPKETLIINFGRQLLGRDKKVSSETFAESVRLFGRAGTIDLVDLMAIYGVTITEMNAYDAHLKPGQKPLLPPLASTPNCAQS